MLCFWGMLPPGFACAPGMKEGRLALAGKVACDGQPLAAGAIAFKPLHGQATAPGGLIQQGRFWIPAEQGADPGDYQVRIYAASSTQAEPAPGQSERTSRPMVERIPRRYNEATTLQVSITAATSTRLTFDLQCQEQALSQ